MNTDSSFVLIERKIKNHSLLRSAFFQSAVYIYIYHHDDIYERFCIRSFVRLQTHVHRFDRTKKKDFSFSCLQSEDSENNHNEFLMKIRLAQMKYFSRLDRDISGGFFSFLIRMSFFTVLDE